MPTPAPSGTWGKLKPSGERLSRGYVPCLHVTCVALG
jgi:hypothetical protein